MTDFILLLIVGACWTWGVHCLFSDGYLFAGVGNKVRKPLNTSPETYSATWYSKPLFDCPPCMASVHGFIVSAVYYDFHIYPMMAFMVCLCGLNFIIKSTLYPEYEDVSPD